MEPRAIILHLSQINRKMTNFRSDFEIFKSEAKEGLHFGLHFLYLLKIQLGSLSKLSGIKN